MANRYDALRDSVYSTVKAAVPALTRQFDAPEAEKRNWRDMVRAADEGAPADAGLSPPWAAVEFGAETDVSEDLAVTCDWRQVAVRVFLIYSWDDGSGGRLTVEGMYQRAYADAQAVKDALWQGKGAAYGMLGRPTIDGTVGNEPNDLFLGMRIPLFGVVVESQAIIGGLLVDGALEVLP